MTHILMVTAPSRLALYQSLASEYAAIEPPVMSALIAQHLLNHGHRVEILDAEARGLTILETATEIRKINPSLAIFSIYGQQPSASTQCLPSARLVASALNGSGILTAALGTHCSALPMRTLVEGPFDFVIEGDGFSGCLGLAETFANRRSISLVSGLWRWDGGRAVRSLPPDYITNDLDIIIKRQAWQLLDMSKYRAHNWHTFGRLDTRNSYASLQTSLGCPFKCEFCCINAPLGSASMKTWSIATVLEQLDELVLKYGVKNIKIPDEMFVLNRKRILELCDEIVIRGYDLNFWAYARVDTLKDDLMLERLKEAGFNWLGVGIESGSKHVRDGVEKGRFGNTDIIATINRVKDHGIHVAANYIFGLPDDTHESMRETLVLAKILNTPWANFYCAMAYPGSPLHTTAKQKGWKLPEDPGGPGWIGYSQHAPECLPLPTETLTAQEVLDFRDDAFHNYFEDPHYLDMIGRTFGLETVDHIRNMTKTRIYRNHRT